MTKLRKISGLFCLCLYAILLLHNTIPHEHNAGDHDHFSEVIRHSHPHAVGKFHHHGGEDHHKAHSAHHHADHHAGANHHSGHHGHHHSGKQDQHVHEHTHIIPHSHEGGFFALFMDFLGHMESGEEEADLKDIFFGEVINLTLAQLDVDAPLHLVSGSDWSRIPPQVKPIDRNLIAPIYDDPPPGPLIPRGPPTLLI